MSDAIHKYGKNAAGAKIDHGRYVVDPSGGVFVLPNHTALKAGWRNATQADIDRKPKQAAPVVAPPAPAPAKPAFMGRKSLSNEESAAIPAAGPRVSRDD